MAKRKQSELDSIVENYIEKKKFKVALAELEKLQEKEEVNGRILYYLGICNANLGEFRRATELLEEALNHSDLSLIFQIHSLLLLGYLYTELKDYETAERSLKDALETNPQSSTAYSALGYIYYQIKRYDLAIYNFKRAIQIDPNNASAHNNLGYTYLEMNINLSEALNECKKAVALDPKSAAYHDSLGWAYYMLGNYEAAVDELEKALKLPTKYKEVIEEHYKSAIKKRNEISRA
ncbi:MAG: tetratricopeptide repeat protein [Brevinematia bacterium]